MDGAHYTFLGAGVALFLVAGCATNNPREGGFLGGIGGLTSGAYDERVQEQQSSLDTLRAANTELESEEAALKAQEATSQSKLQAERQRLASLEAETERLSTKVQALEVEDQEKQARVADLKQRVAELEAKIQQVSSPMEADALEGDGTEQLTGDERRRELEAQRHQLEEEYRLLTEMYLKLGS